MASAFDCDVLETLNDRLAASKLSHLSDGRTWRKRFQNLGSQLLPIDSAHAGTPSARIPIYDSQKGRNWLKMSSTAVESRSK
jgi:hypothetical protein